MPDAMPIPTLLRTLLADPGRPRLTWYGPDGERIELSGHVLDNWVTKTANLLVEEFDAGPGTRVLLGLPPHWRATVWALAVWRTGAHVVLGTTRSPADVVVTHRPAELPAPLLAGRPEVVAVALPALARAFDGALPPGAVDANGAVMTYGDVLGYVPEPDASADALTLGDTGDTAVPHSGLEAWARGTVDLTAPRLLVATVADGADGSPDAGATEQARTLAAVVSALASDGSVVLCAPEVTSAMADDGPDGLRARVVAGERVTHVLGPGGSVEPA